MHPEEVLWESELPAHDTGLCIQDLLNPALVCTVYSGGWTAAVRAQPGLVIYGRVTDYPHT